MAGNYGCAAGPHFTLPAAPLLWCCCASAAQLLPAAPCFTWFHVSVSHPTPPRSYVKLAVATYDTLLLSSRPEKSNLLANELVVRTVVKRRT